MGAERRNVIVSDRGAAYNETFRRGLEAGSGEPWEVWSCVSNNGRSRGYNFIRYFKYLFFPLLVFLRRGRYRRIVAWQGFYAVQLDFWSRVLGWLGSTPPDLVLGIPLIYRPKRGWVGCLYRRWLRFSACRGRPGHYVVTAEGARAGLSEALGIEPERIHFFSFGLEDATEKPEWKAPRTRNPDWEEGSYWVAVGRSNRDYGWLEKAWRGSGERLHILCDEWSGGWKGEGREEVRVSRDLQGKSAWPEYREAKGVVLPLKDGQVDSGVLGLLQAYMAGKPVVVTGPSLLAEEYVRHGETGLVVEKDADGRALQASLARLDREPGLARQLGKAGRKEFETAFSEFEYGRRIGKWIREEAPRPASPPKPD